MTGIDKLVLYFCDSFCQWCHQPLLYITSLHIHLQLLIALQVLLKLIWPRSEFLVLCIWHSVEVIMYITPLLFKKEKAVEKMSSGIKPEV